MNAATQTPTRWFSLRRRLLALLLGGVTIGWLATLALSYADAHHEIDEIFDAQLVQTAQTLLALAGELENEVDDDDTARLEGEAHKYQKKVVFQLWDDEGNLLLRSRRAPTTLLAQSDGFSGAGENGRWRFYSQWDREHQLRAVVGEDHQVREELAAHIVARLLVPGLFGLPLLGVWLWFATRRGLAPIAAVTAEVVSRAPERLEPLVPVAAPSEIRPLLDALNALFSRVEHALDGERRFTADAAHELRTPLAALVAQAQVAQRARDATERDHAITQITASSQRASRLVEQLLTLARLDPAAGIPRASVPLDELAAAACADHGAAALAKDICLELDASAGVTVFANADMLRILLRNLLDNALRYTPVGGKVSVTVANPLFGIGVMKCPAAGTAGATGVTLTVGDSGPGIPEAERENALCRFHRLAGQDSEGSGLGLSIVARIAELHGARLELADGLGVGSNTPGLSVRLIFEPA